MLKIASICKKYEFVIPAEAGIQVNKGKWIPSFEGMTIKLLPDNRSRTSIPACPNSKSCYLCFQLCINTK